MFIPEITKNKFKKIPTNQVGIFVKEWNLRYPLDRWFREKHSILWGSKEHRETELLSIYFQFEEEKLYRQVVDSLEEEKKEKKIYTPGNWFNSEGESIDTEEIEDLYDKIDISNIEEDSEGNIIIP